MSTTTHSFTHDFANQKGKLLQTDGKVTCKPLLATQGRGQFEKKEKEKL
jgi:hypothetical protein